VTHPEPAATDTLVAALRDRAERREVQAGDVVIEAGVPGDGLLHVLEGRFEVRVAQRGRSIRAGEIGPGAVMGGISLLAGGAPTATITALEPGLLEVVSRPVARAMLATEPGLRERLEAQARETIDRDALLHVLAQVLDADDVDLAATARRLAVRTVPAGTVLCRQGEPGGSTYVVVAGRLAVLRDDGDGDGEREIARLGRGQVVGEASMLTGEPRSATLVAVRDAVVGEVDEDAFHDLLVDHPAITREVLRQVVRRAERGNLGTGRRTVSTVAVAAAPGALDPEDYLRTFGAALEPFGTLRRLGADEVDTDLGTSDIARAAADAPGAGRLAAYLHEQEAAHDLLLLDVGAGVDGWTRRATRVSDRVVVVLPADPDEQDRAHVRALLAEVPQATTTIAVLQHPADTDRPSGTAVLRDALGVDDVLHVRVGRPGDVERTARLATSRATALVLGGGGARGFAHVGVHRAMHELGIPIDMVLGASIGAPLAGGIALDATPDELEPIIKRLFKGLLDYTVPVTSLIKGERIARAILEHFGDIEYEDLWLPFRCVSTNLTTSRSEVHASGPVAPTIRASVAIPGVMPPVPMGEDLLVDGGLLDNLPVGVAADDGRCRTIIAVDVAPPRGPRAKADYGLSVSGWQSLRASVGRGRSQFPGITAVLMRSMLVGAMVNRQDALDSAGVDLLMELDVRGVSLLDFEAVAEVAAKGYDLALPLLQEWIATGDCVPLAQRD